jgi:DNA-binding transcriptional ArsR family regulator
VLDAVSRVPFDRISGDAAANQVRALAEPSRLGIVRLLVPRDYTIGQLAWALGLSQPNASRHVAILASAGLVERVRVGVSVVCRLADPRVSALLEALDAFSDAAGAENRPPPSLADCDADDVEYALVMGAAVVRCGLAGVDEWSRRMLDHCDRYLAVHMAQLRVATLRIARGEPLDGLPLPPAILERQQKLIKEMRRAPGTVLPAE